MKIVDFTNFHPSKGIYYLFGIYLLIVVAVLLRSHVESTHYCTPDSAFYLRVAQNLVEGKGLVAPQVYPFDADTPESHFTVWPAAYPVMIFMVGSWTGISFLMASKLINLLFLGAIFVLLYKMFGDKAWFPALYFFSYGKMEVFSYTWSEGVFLFFVLLLLYFLIKKDVSHLLLKITLCLLMLFLLRYAGVIYFLFVGLYALVIYFRDDKKIAKTYLLAVFAASVPSVLYLFNNYLEGGYATGLERFTPLEMSTWFSFLSSLVGVVNEALFAGNYFITKNNFTSLFWVYLPLQLAMVCFVFSKRKHIVSPFFSQKYMLFVTAAFFYLLSVVVLQRLNACSHFDYRILAPFSTPLFLVLFASFVEENQHVFYKKTRLVIVGFMLFCYLTSLPKYFLLNLFS